MMQLLLRKISSRLAMFNLLNVKTRESLLLRRCFRTFASTFYCIIIIDLWPWKSFQQCTYMWGVYTRTAAPLKALCSFSEVIRLD